MVSELSAEDDHAGAEAGRGVGLVPVGEQRAGEAVRVHRPPGREVVHDEPPRRLDGDLAALVAAGIVGRADPVLDAVPGEEGLHLLGGVHGGTVGGEDNWNAPSGKVLT